MSLTPRLTEFVPHNLFDHFINVPKCAKLSTKIKFLALAKKWKVKHDYKVCQQLYDTLIKKIYYMLSLCFDV